MSEELTIEQRFALTRARYEVTRMSRPALEKTALRLLKSRMEQKNGIQNTLLSSGIVFKIEEQQGGLPEIISEQTFIDLLQMQSLSYNLQQNYTTTQLLALKIDLPRLDATSSHA